MREGGRFGPRVLGLDFGRVDFDTHCPGGGEEHGVEVDADDHDPTGGPVVGVDRVGRVQSAHQQDRDRQPQPADDGAGAAAPFIREEERRDGDDDQDDARNAGGEKGGFLAGEAGLLEKQRRVLFPLRVSHVQANQG